MVNAVPFTPKPAIAKLPLAVRKDIRDNFAAKKEDLQARIKALEGTDFTIKINAAEVWAYAEEGNTSAGTCFEGYVEGLISALETFMKFNENGKTFFNEAGTQSELTLTVNPLGHKGEAISSDVKDGVYRILFRHDRSDTTATGSVHSTMLPAIESAPREGFLLSANSSIESDYDDEVDEAREESDKLVGTDIPLDPNFEEV
ncbi:hypothetical protein FB451DRAFT_1151892 [Mycena latifolia]|nr:hypothetical protein FB451DRAFT_1151892 [Mycena latifolia]